MSKMIRVDSCGDCKYFALEHVRVGKFYCTHPKMNLAEIKDSSKVLPNCPLEDYPETGRDDTKEG